MLRYTTRRWCRCANARQRNPSSQITAVSIRAKHVLEKKKKGEYKLGTKRKFWQQCYIAQSFGDDAIVRPVNTPTWMFPTKHSSSTRAAFRYQMLVWCCCSLNTHWPTAAKGCRFPMIERCTSSFALRWYRWFIKLSAAFFEISVADINTVHGHQAMHRQQHATLKMAVLTLGFPMYVNDNGQRVPFSNVSSWCSFPSLCSVVSIMYY